MEKQEHITNQNAISLEKEVNWLREVIHARLKLFFNKDIVVEDVFEITPPDFSTENSVYAEFVREHKLGFEERIILIMALIPHIRPEVLDYFFIKNSTYDKPFSEFGGSFEKNYSQFYPTIETALFVLSNNDFSARFRVQQIFDVEHIFIEKNILKLENVQNGLPIWNALLKIESDFVDYFTLGHISAPDFSTDFPARKIKTDAVWADLVISEKVKSQILEIKDWDDHGSTLLNDWELGKSISKGYKCLFYGPSGTGKTMTASVLGKLLGKSVYKIDLSMVVSKYIGETEKNLAKVFKKAESRNWILFFDEADSLFGKRSETKQSNDRYANQEISYLLQRIEDFSGITILATNLKDNMDKAFTRRFHAMINFTLPGIAERTRLWEQSFSSKTQLETELDVAQLAKSYKVSGAQIVNAVRYCSIQAAKSENALILKKDVMKAIKRELAKEEITLL